MPSDESITEGELREFLAVSFAEWWLPDHFLFVAEIPKTGVGEYDKKEIRAALNDGGLGVVQEKFGPQAAAAPR